MNLRSAIIILIFLFAIGCGQNKKTNESNCNHHVGHDMLGAYSAQRVPGVAEYTVPG